MTTQATFDYYAELQVERTASQQEITSSYRKLARIHHPDKNPDNVESATASFQKIQQAYECLNAPADRRRYDAAGSSNSRPAPSHPYYYDYSAEDEFESHEASGADFYKWFFNNSYRNSRNFFPFNFSTRPSPSYDYGPRHHGSSFEEMDQRFRAMEEEEAKRRAALLAEREARERAAAARKEAKNTTKSLLEEIMKHQKANEHQDERLKQEGRWRELNAITEDEKLKACLHSSFCSKVTQKKKFKCNLCGQKRGIISFECPYCSVLLCQHCLSKSSDKRAALEKVASKSRPNSTGRSDTASEDYSEKRDSSSSAGSVKSATSRQDSNSAKVGGTGSADGPVDDKMNAESAKVHDTESAVPRPPRGSKHCNEPRSPKDMTHGTSGAPKVERAAGAGRDTELKAKVATPVPSNSKSRSTAAKPNFAAETTGIKKVVPGKPTSTAADVETKTAKASQVPADAEAHGSEKRAYRPRVMTTFHGNQVDITDLGIDADFLTELPEDIREEVIMNAMAERRQQTAAKDKTIEETVPIGHSSSPGTGIPGPTSKGVTEEVPKPAIHKSSESSQMPRSTDAKSKEADIKPDDTKLATPGSSAGCAFVRCGGLSKNLTVPILKEAMERFGDVASVKLEKYKGIAFVNFVEHEALLAAIAASPVPVAQSTVRVEKYLDRKNGPPRRNGMEPRP